MFLLRYSSLHLLARPSFQMPYLICFTIVNVSRFEETIFASCFYLDNDELSETFDRHVVLVAGRWKKTATKPACDCLGSQLSRVHKTILSTPPSPRAISFLFFF